MNPRSLLLAGTIASMIMLSVGVVQGAGVEEELAASLKADVWFSDASGMRTESPEAGQPFTVAVSLHDVVTSEQAVLKDGILGWIRPVDESNAKCAEAARNYRATQRLPTGSIDMNGVVVANITTEGNILFIDPKLDLASSNILAAMQLEEPAASIVTDSRQRLLYASLASAGRVVSANPFGTEIKTFASGLDRPGGLLLSGNGGIWVAEESTGKLVQLSINGKRLKETTLGVGPIKLHASGHLAVATSETGGILVFDLNTGAELYRHKSKGMVDSAIWLDGDTGSLLTVERNKRNLELRFLDSPGRVQSIPLAAPATRLSVSPNGQWAFAYDPQGAAVSLVDIGSGQLIQGLAFTSGVAEVAFAGDTSFLRLSDGSAVATVAMNSIKAGENAEVGRIILGGAVTDGSAAGEGLLVPLGETENMIAVHPQTFAGFIISSQMRTSNSLPQTGLRLRGGIPKHLAVIDRSFIKASDGVYRSTATVPHGGTYEFIFTTGIRGLTSCLAFEVKGASRTVQQKEVSLVPLDIDGGYHSGQTTSLKLKIWDGKNPVLQDQQIKLRVSSLDYGLRLMTTGRIGPDGVTAQIVFPAPGDYVIEALDLPPGYSLRGVPQIQVMP